MKYVIAALLTFFLIGCTGNLTTPQIVEKVQNGVVLITNEVASDKGGMGTGFIVDDNKIVTNNHVIDGGGKLTVYSRNSQTKYDADVVFTDPLSDVAIVELKDWKKFKEKERPTDLQLGDSDDEKVGEKVVVIGHPWGLTWSVSEGIISGKNRRPDRNPKFVDQLDAHVFNGNSGGPIFNDKGQVVCISNLMYVREGGSYGFCVPTTLVKKVIYDYDKLKEVRWRVLNIAAAPSEDGSAIIAKDVEPQGAAGMAGIKVGDKLLKISTPNNHPNGIKIKSPDDLITELASLRGDDEVIKLAIERDGKELVIDVKTNYKLSKEY